MLNIFQLESPMNLLLNEALSQTNAENIFNCLGFRVVTLSYT